MNKKGFIQMLPIILLAAFAVTTFIIASKVQTEKAEIRSKAASFSAPVLTPTPAVSEVPLDTLTAIRGSGRCQTDPVRYSVQGVGWCEGVGVRCHYQNNQVGELPDPWCDREGGFATTCIGVDQKAETSIPCVRPAPTTCGDGFCQAPLENWNTCASDCP